MRALVKVILIIGLVSASSFFLVQFTGLITIDKIEAWFTALGDISPLYIGCVVICLMIIDLFVSIPTLATIILAGHFMGFQYGALAAIIGLQCAGNLGYFLGTKFGEPILNLLLKEEEQKIAAKNNFNQHGLAMILLSRAVPVLPEITTCLSGMSSMSYSKFLIAWSISIIPYTLFAAYAGSLSSPSNPEPAIMAWAILSCILWSGWYLYNRKTKSNGR